MAGSDSTRMTGLDWVVIGAGALAGIASFLPWYRVRISLLDIERSASSTAWDVGFGAWFPVVLLLAGAVVLASSAVIRLPAPRPLITLVLSALAVVMIVLRWVTFPDAGGVRDGLNDLDLGSVFSASSGADLGLYLGLIAAVVATVASILAFRRMRQRQASP